MGNSLDAVERIPHEALFLLQFIEHVAEHIGQGDGAVIFALAAQPPVPPTGVSEAALGVAREEGFAIVQFLWPKLWRKVLTGDREWVEAARKGMVCLGSFEPAYRSDATRRKALFQMAWDLAWCAAKAYDDAGGKGPAADACSQLLREIENALNEAKEAQPPNTWLRNALTDPKVAESLRPVRVRRAVVEDWLDFLKADGVVKRDIVPTSQPATRPSPAR